MHFYLGYDDLEHAIIELLVDNELRTRLNGGSYPPMIGHEHLAQLRMEILPFWEDYLKMQKKNIKKFRDSLSALNIQVKKSNVK